MSMSAVMRNHVFLLTFFALAAAFRKTLGGARDNHQRTENARLETLAGVFFSLPPVVALRSSVAQAQRLAPVRPRIAKMTKSDALDQRSELRRIGQLAAEWCVATDRGEATIAVSGAASTAEVLRDFWRQARELSDEAGEVGRQRILALPMWKEGNENVISFQHLLTHITACGELSELIGAGVLVNGRNKRMGGSPCALFLMRAFTQPEWEDLEEARGEDPFAEAWREETGEILHVATDQEVLAQTRNFVQGIIVDMRVCPHSSSVEKAGMPAGGVTYLISPASTVEEVYQSFWEQVILLQSRDQYDVATVLLITPKFGLYSPGAYDMLGDTLDKSLADLEMENEIQLMFFHPEFAHRDGFNRLGDEGSGNYARRSPYPMISLKRAPQIQKARDIVPMGAVCSINEENLKSVGQSDLQRMLEERNWQELRGRNFVEHDI